jgi:hypothetical protein
MLDVYGRLCLYGEADQAQRKQESGIGVLLARLVFCLQLWIPLVEVMCAPPQQAFIHAVVLGLAP